MKPCSPCSKLLKFPDFNLTIADGIWKRVLNSKMIYSKNQPEFIGIPFTQSFISQGSHCNSQILIPDWLKMTTKCNHCNPDISSALYTLNLSILNSQYDEGARDVNNTWVREITFWYFWCFGWSNRFFSNMNLILESLST